MSRSLGRNLLLVGTILFLVLFLVYPLLFVAGKTIYSDKGGTTWVFSALLSSPQLVDSFFRSVNIALATTIVTTVITLPVALLLGRYRFFGSRMFTGLLLLPMILPPFVGAIGIRKIFARFGPLNLLLMKLEIIAAPIDWLGGGGVWGVVFTQALHLFPILLLNLSAALAAFDPAMEEAAKVLGAGPFRIFRRITVPLLLPGYFAGASIVFIWALTDLGTPLVFDVREVIAVKVFQLADEIHTNPLGYGLVTVLLLMSAAFFLIAKSALDESSVVAQSKGGPRGARLKQLTGVKALFAFGGLSALLFLAVLPHLGVIISSFAKQWFMAITPQQLSFEAYGALAVHPLLQSSIRNSLALSFASTTLDLVLGIVIAWFLARSTIPGRRALDALTMLPLAVPGIVIAFGYLGCFSGTWLDPRHNPVPLLIFGYSIRRLPFIVRALYSGFQQSRPELEQAAALFGATQLQTVRRITLPLLLPHLIAGAVLCFCFAMLEVSESLLLALEERFYPITKAMYILLGRPDGPVIASALGVVCMILIALCLFIARKLTGRGIADIMRI